MNIRQCTPADIDIITRFTLALHQHENEQGLRPHPNLAENIRNWLASEITSNNSLILIAEIDNHPIGFICAATVINDNGFIAQPIKGIIQLLWIEAPHRKQKAAEKLLNTIELCLLESGVTYVECSFVSGNKQANNFWKSQGYQITSMTCRKFISSEN